MEGARRPPGGTRGMGRGRIRTRSPTGGRAGSRSPDRTMPQGSGDTTSTSFKPKAEGLSAEMAELNLGDLPITSAAPAYPRGATRGARHHVEMLERKYDLVQSRPEGKVKRGEKGTPIDLTANYYRLKTPPAWKMAQYDVSFEPEEDSNNIKRKLVRKIMEEVNAGYLFDGRQLFVSSSFGEEKIMTMVKIDPDRDGTQRPPYQLTLKFVGNVDSGSPQYMQLYNLLVRKVMFALNLKEMGRHFFDPEAIVTVPAYKLELWPGFITSMRSHEKDVLLCVEVTHKVIRQDTVLQIIEQQKRTCRGDVKKAILDEFKDTVVLTRFNNKTYHVDDIDFSQNPLSTFDFKGKQISFVEYYKGKGITIQDVNQPLIVSNPTKKELRSGMTGTKLLVPELCQPTGLTDAMRSNFSLMKDLSKHLHQAPSEKVKVIENFMKRLQTNEKISAEFKRWGFEFERKLVTFQGRQLPNESMIFAAGEQKVDDKGDFTMAFRSQKMLSSQNLTKWAILVPQRDFGGVDNLIQTMIKVARPLAMTITPPVKVIQLQDTRVQTYLRFLGEMLRDHPDIQMLFVILPNNKLETYAAVKKLLAHEKGIISQCFVAKNVMSKGLMSIATKVVVQMNAKMGGEPWTIKLPMKNTMFVGFDVYHGAKGSKKGNIGAMVASYSPKFTRYYSTTSVFQDDIELTSNMCADMKKCLDAFKAENGCFPERIFLYRDGVGDGQIRHVFSVEVSRLRASLKSYYEEKGSVAPKLTFIVVTKKINTRLLLAGRNGLSNPGPGSIADDVVTLPERYDFYLISCAARQGTVSPCSYNVLHDESGFEADRIQLITYKLCHMYFNWSGTIAVPAPCQYAHKLAFLTGMAYSGHAHNDLAKFLHFL